MNKQITVPFEVTLWDVKPYDEPANNPTLLRGTIEKTFDGDEMQGASQGEVLMYTAADGSAGYTIMDRVTASLCGRTGSFVMIHGATHTPAETSRALGAIMPNSATGELAGLLGSVEFLKDEIGKRIRFDLTFVD